ncbi:MAG TPA: phosphate ABC transporter substrate-binding protein PstS, partial [Gemmataceae bacterium]|nr:phosphate ABC transporter substrate-binding protein PstS [Gemmataceae bacterium]
MRLRSLSPAVAALALFPLGCGRPDGVTIQGAGATFPAPLYKRWFLEYYTRHLDVRVNYQAIGSGSGIRQFTEGVVAFGASDAFMSKGEIEKVPAGRGVVLIPMTAGSIVLCYNLPGGPPELRLTRQAYADIFLGRVTKWNDPAIADANHGVSLPGVEITVVRRADSSGTTYNLTNHLSAISEVWKKEKGTDKVIKDPVGIAGKGNSGVAALVQQTPGAFGYLEYGYAELAHLPMAHLENKHGAFVKPTPESGAAALAGITVPDNLQVNVPDPDGEAAYPIVTCTWLLCARHYDDAKKGEELKNVVRYCLTDGQQVSGELGYIPLPEDLR